MSSVAIWLPTAFAVAMWMEVWAALLHGKVWHRALWRIHRSHHARRRGALEANDALSALHAPIAIAFVLYGCRADAGPLREIVFGVGVGMSVFGVAYFVVHDGLVHGRLPVAALAKSRYFARVRDAHLAHHASDGGPYGLFLGPWEHDIRQASPRARRERPNARPAPLRASTAPLDTRPVASPPCAAKTR